MHWACGVRPSKQDGHRCTDTKGSSAGAQHMAGAGGGAWSPAWMRQHLGLPPPDTVVDEATVLQETLAKLREPTQTGFKYTYKSGKRFQSKPYIRPGVQRTLGNFSSAEEAATQIIRLCYGCISLPPSPKKDRAKRGEGPRPRQRRKGAAPIPLPCLLSKFSLLLIDSCAQRGQICASAGLRQRRRPAARLAQEAAPYPSLIAWVAARGCRAGTKGDSHSSSRPPNGLCGSSVSHCRLTHTRSRSQAVE
jgi:hypothetical protein